MNRFTQDNKFLALTKAVKKINRIKRTRVGYAYGISDCWSMFCEYDNLLRDNDYKLKNLFAGYTSQEAWMDTLHNTLKMSSPVVLFNANDWSTLGIEDTVLGDVAVFTYDNNSKYWSVAIKVTETQWRSSSNIEKYEVLTTKFIKKNLKFCARAS
jgi:hypothetical protein